MRPGASYTNFCIYKFFLSLGDSRTKPEFLDSDGFSLAPL